MDIVNIIFLSVLFILHWAIMIGMGIYIFFRKNKKYDWIYFTAFCLLIIQWIFMKECIISYLEKVIMDNNYKMGDSPYKHPSTSLYSNDFNIITFIPFLFTLLLIYNLYKLLRIYNVPLPIVLIICISFILYILYWRVYAIIDNELKDPELIKSSPSLKKFYEKRTDTPISFTDVIYRVGCFLQICSFE